MISHEINKPFLSDVSGQAADVGSLGDIAERDQLLLHARPLPLLLADVARQS
jgi:hypothetical protein